MQYWIVASSVSHRVAAYHRARLPPVMRAARVIYVNAAGAGSFAVPGGRASYTPFQSLRQQLRSRAFATGPANVGSATASTASTGAASAGHAAGATGVSVGSTSFFKSDSWTKTVGTIGALANWSIPLAAIAHITSNKDPATTIDPWMTSSLAVYSLLFMRWAIAITPPNYPLLVCHVANEVVQLTQLGRYMVADKSKQSTQTTASSPTIAINTVSKS